MLPFVPHCPHLQAALRLYAAPVLVDQIGTTPDIQATFNACTILGFRKQQVVRHLWASHISDWFYLIFVMRFSLLCTICSFMDES